PPPQEKRPKTTAGERQNRGKQGEQKPFDKGGFKKTGERPSQPQTQKPSMTRVAPIDLPTAKDNKRAYDKKKDHNNQNKTEDKKAMSRRTLIRKGFIPDEVGEERMGTRKLKNKKAKAPVVVAPIKIEKAVITTENLTVKILSEKIGKTAQEIIKQLMLLGIMTNINGVVDFQTMELVANELGVELELKLEQTQEEKLEAMHDEEDAEESLVKRPPIITVMGHVDHGKTSLLDAIRKTAVAAGEAGGITQHIGAYSVMCKGEKITFLDTPGHEAFTEMRARGTNVTDIAVLIVAADDGVMPQTIESINHAKAAKVPVVVAINKIDKPGANIEKVKQALTEYDLIPEEWGGDTIMVPISAKSGEGVDKLLEMILFLAEYNNYRANPSRHARGSIIESKLDKGKGPVANIVVLNGTLHVGDYIVSGTTSGRVRGMVDDKGRSVKEALPATPVSVLGFTDVPNAGDGIFVVEDEKTARQIVAERTAKIKNEQANAGTKITLDDVFNKISEGQMKELNILIKADVQGSVEALKTSLEKLSNDEVKVVVVHGGVGAINKSDLMLAGVSNAIIIGFNVRPDSEAKALAESTGVEVKLYNIIYEAIDDVEAAMKGLVAPKYHETIIGRAQIRNVIKISGVGAIAGSYVMTGKVTRNAKVRIYRDDVVIFDGAISNLKRFKDDVKEVAQGYECGLSFDGFDAFKENDEIEAYVLEQDK
ncbi:MAG: translation initiation factor IF-2, partial [Clostridia bacterium]|nr:translation initiation factor IF-2 [Clostridia bacterium]